MSPHLAYRHIWPGPERLPPSRLRGGHTAIATAAGSPAHGNFAFCKHPLDFVLVAVLTGLYGHPKGIDAKLWREDAHGPRNGLQAVVMAQAVAPLRLELEGENAPPPAFCRPPEAAC